MTRSLAAILAADIVGYARLMGENQAGTLEALRRLRAELLAPAFAGHHGEVVKSMGDGWLVEFPAAADAVACALQVQDRLAEHPTIRLRVGVHVGDVVHEDDDIFGDGVNIAARLEQVAEPGGIAISDAAYSSIDGALRPSFDDAGERQLKNIERPVQVWMRHAGAALPGRAETGRAVLPRLAILPVAAAEPEGEIAALAAGLTGDLALYLGSLRWLATRVTDRPGPGAYVLRATLRAAGGQVRLEARLAGPDGAPIWSEKHDGALAESFEWQDRTGEEVAAHVLWRVLDLERAKLAGLTIDEMTAEQCNLKGAVEFELLDHDALAASLGYHAAAIDKDPRLADAYADAIATYLSAVAIGFGDIARRYAPQFERWLADGSALTGAGAILGLAVAIAAYTRDKDGARLRRALRDALRREPLSMDVNSFAGWGHIWLGEPQAALGCFARARRLRRFSPWAVAAICGEGLACVQSGRDEAALERVAQGLEVTRDYAALYRVQTSALALLGRLDEAAAAIAEAMRLVPGDTRASLRTRVGYADTPGNARFFEGLRLAGMPD